MKKLVILLTITCMAMGVHAQSYLGIKAGGGLAGLSTSGTLSHSYAVNIASGLVYKQQIFQRVMLEADVLFDIRRTDVELVPNTITQIGADYIAVPITIHWMVPFKKRELVPYRTGQPNSFFFVEGGPQVMYGLNAVTYQDPITIPLELDAKDIKANSLDVGVIGGMGINLGFSKFAHRLVIGGRASYGFLNFNNYKGAPTMTNLGFGGYLEWDFALSKRRYYQYKY